MYQAIEAIAKAGTIEPLEPVLFDENEHLVILRLSKTFVGTVSAPTLEARAIQLRRSGFTTQLIASAAYPMGFVADFMSN